MPPLHLTRWGRRPSPNSLRVVDRVLFEPTFVASFFNVLPRARCDARSEMPAVPKHAGAKADYAAEKSADNSLAGGPALIPQVPAQCTQAEADDRGTHRALGGL